MPASFFSLTPDWVLRAVEAGGFAPTGHVSALLCLENRVYDVRLEGGQHVVVKFYRPGRWSREAVAEEHAFLAELRRAEIPVCAPLAFYTAKALRHALMSAPRVCLWPAACVLFLIASNVAESQLLRHKLGWALYVAAACHLATRRPPSQ